MKENLRKIFYSLIYIKDILSKFSSRDLYKIVCVAFFSQDLHFPEIIMIIFIKQMSNFRRKIHDSAKFISYHHYFITPNNLNTKYYKCICGYSYFNDIVCLL